VHGLSPIAPYCPERSVGQGPLELTSFELEALAFLLPLSADYPGIHQWYLTKVIPGLRQQTRHLLRVERDGKLVGLGIAKNEPDEHKICTVRVAPDWASRGMGVRIFDGLLKWLDDDRPHLTVSERKLPLFSRLFEYYGFNLSSSKRGAYLPTACEFGYNDAILAGAVGDNYLGPPLAGSIDPSSFSISGSSAHSCSVLPDRSGTPNFLA
jgi:hypothetical protein